MVSLNATHGPTGKLSPQPWLDTPETKAEIAKTIVDFYPMLPAFYVGVVFHEMPRDRMFVSGKPTDDFVRIAVDHIARQFPEDALAQKWLNHVSASLAAFTSDLGYRWEVHFDETPFKFWRIQGYPAPLPDSEAERKWKADDAACPYDFAA